jgi:DNA processing protein
MSTPHAAYWHALNQITKGNSWKLWTPSQYLGGPDKIFQTSTKILLESGLSQKQADYLRAACSYYPITKEFSKVLTDGTQILIKNDRDYPEWLAQIYDSPSILYVKGNPQLLSQPSIAIVGSRNMTNYGREVIKKLVPPLVHSGLGVISGLAYGVDAAALRMSLSCSAPTIAVVASSLHTSELSPRANAGLALEISKNGCLVSETPPGCRPAKGRFPLRNRIVSGISRGVLVIEAAMRSGSLITARLALEQNREVFAVPGPIHAPYSQGTLWLIQQGAKCVMNPNDVLLELNLPVNQYTVSPIKFIPQNVIQKNIWTIFDLGPATVDELVIKTGLQAAEILPELTAMEIAGSLRRLAHGVYDKAT